MKTEDSQKVAKRFYRAIYELKAMKVIRGKKTFTDAYGINRWNFNNIEKNTESGMFETAWLTYLVEDFGVSAEWLLTGKGKMFNRIPEKR